MAPPLPDPLHVIHIIREVASREIMPRFRNLAATDVSHKRHSRDLVTIADTEAERRLAERLQPLSPGSAVVGEEGTEADAGVLAALGGTAPVWLLDPIDGTANYACGKVCFAVIVGFCAGGETLAGWIYDPIADVVLWAVAGEGAWLEHEGERERARVAAGGAIGGMKGSLSRRVADRLFGVSVACGGGQPPEIVRYGSVG
ncbi:MAG: inositol monophosphatase family protein, partial [Bacteroidota bacterium]